MDLSRVDHVIKELLDTETIYIKEIEEVLMGYGRLIDNDPSDGDCPDMLRGKRFELTLIMIWSEFSPDKFNYL